MSTTEKKIMFGLPLKIILTENGASYFISRKKKLLRFRLADNADEYGIFFNKFSPQSVQRMILLDYISKIEISMTEFVSAWQEVMDLSKLIVYSLLYKPFDREVYSALIKCACVSKSRAPHRRRNVDKRSPAQTSAVE